MLEWFFDLMLSFGTGCSENRTAASAGQLEEKIKLNYILEGEKGMLIFFVEFSFFNFQLVLFTTNNSKRL